MSDEDRGQGSAGGVARATVLPPKRRSEIAKAAAKARWESINPKDVRQATHAGVLPIGDVELPCAVLEDGTRVLSERGVTKALGGKRGGSHWRRKKALVNLNAMPVYVSAGNLRPFIPHSLEMALSQPVPYKGKHGGIANGIDAALLPEICNVWLKARDAGVLTPQQHHIAAKADILMRGLATVGIIALVDEATGFQEDRDKQALHRILKAYIRKELLPWTQRFPTEFYQEMFRLRGWEYSPPSPKRPKLVGKLTNQLVYEKLPPGVLEELRRKNPVVKDGWRKYKHHQFLTEDMGNPHLEKQVAAVMTLMRASPSWGIFKKLFQRAFPMLNSQPEIPGLDVVDADL